MSAPLVLPVPWYEFSGTLNAATLGVRNVAGAVDSFSVPIVSTHSELDNAARSRLFKGSVGPCIKCTVVSDAVGRIPFVKIGSPYATSDREDLLFSGLGHSVTCRGDTTLLPRPYVLLGDSAYRPGSASLLVSFRDANARLSAVGWREQLAWNFLMNSVRSSVERAINAIRQSFQLSRSSARTQTGKVLAVEACRAGIVLHNYRITHELMAQEKRWAVKRRRQYFAHCDHPLVPWPRLVAPGRIADLLGWPVGMPLRVFTPSHPADFTPDEPPSSSSSLPPTLPSLPPSSPPERAAMVHGLIGSRRRRAAARTDEERRLLSMLRELSSSARHNILDYYDMITVRDAIVREVWNDQQHRLVLLNGHAWWRYPSGQACADSSDTAASASSSSLDYPVLSSLDAAEPPPASISAPDDDDVQSQWAAVRLARARSTAASRHHDRIVQSFRPSELIPLDRGEFFSVAEALDKEAVEQLDRASQDADRISAGTADA